MNRYDPAVPRAAFGIAAAIMSAMTIGILVVLPSKMEPESQAFAQLATANSLIASRCVRVDPGCVEPVAGRDATATPGQILAAEPRCREQG